MAKKGETRKKIIDGASQIFFEKGYEATSIKMILEKVGIVTGSFYHFFSSKQELFEAVVEQFLNDYSKRVSDILLDESLKPHTQLQLFLQEIKKSSSIYFNVLQANKLHWTIEHALHNKTIIMLIDPISEMLDRQMKAGIIESKLDVDNYVLASMIVHGIETILHSNKDNFSIEDFSSEAKIKQIYKLIDEILVIHDNSLI